MVTSYAWPTRRAVSLFLVLVMPCAVLASDTVPALSSADSSASVDAPRGGSPVPDKGKLTIDDVDRLMFQLDDQRAVHGFVARGKYLEIESNRLPGSEWAKLMLEKKASVDSFQTLMTELAKSGNVRACWYFGLIQLRAAFDLLYRKDVVDRALLEQAQQYRDAAFTWFADVKDVLPVAQVACDWLCGKNSSVLKKCVSSVAGYSNLRRYVSLIRWYAQDSVKSAG